MPQPVRSSREQQRCRVHRIYYYSSAHTCINARSQLKDFVLRPCAASLEPNSPILSTYEVLVPKLLCVRNVERMMHTEPSRISKTLRGASMILLHGQRCMNYHSESTMERMEKDTDTLGVSLPRLTLSRNSRLNSNWISFSPPSYTPRSQPRGAWKRGSSE